MQYEKIPPKNKQTNKKKQVVAPKGLDISRPMTVILPNHIGFAQPFSR